MYMLKTRLCRCNIIVDHSSCLRMFASVYRTTNSSMHLANSDVSIAFFREMCPLERFLLSIL